MWIFPLMLLVFSKTKGQEIKSPNATVNEIAIFMNSEFVSESKENITNLVSELIAELDENVFTAGNLKASFYLDEIPRFTKGTNPIEKMSSVSPNFLLLQNWQLCLV